jgi:NADPH:quinone reductase-like Zn-dependent oxidoreductase
MRPETMRAMVLTGFGSYDTLHYRPDIPVPTPADDEVLVKVAACGINNTDIWTREGAYGTGENSGHMLNRAEVATGETVLITGASGGVGSALVQLARLRGARVIAVIGRGKEGHLEGLGVHGIIFRGTENYWEAIQRQLPYPNPPDYQCGRTLCRCHRENGRP